ncbi:MAG: hypothetical protein ACK559_35360, partial [bacterium]
MSRHHGVVKVGRAGNVYVPDRNPRPRGSQVLRKVRVEKGNEFATAWASLGEALAKFHCVRQEV